MGFTLAEVLITLGIIGVVAAMTIPALMNNTNKAEYVTALKKANTTISQALMMYQASNGDIASAFAGDGTPAASVASLNAIAPYLNITKNCGSTMGCWYDTPIKFLGGTVESDNWDTTMNALNGKAILADGSLIVLKDYPGECVNDQGDGPLDGKVCALFAVDINGFKGPNTKGRDYFLFWITKTGVFPFGSNGDPYSCVSNSATWATSQGCTAKVLVEGAMNY